MLCFSLHRPLLAPLGLTQYGPMIHLSLLSFESIGHLHIVSFPVQYVDYVGSWGPAIVGHAHPEVTEALTEQIKKVRYCVQYGGVACSIWAGLMVWLCCISFALAAWRKLWQCFSVHESRTFKKSGADAQGTSYGAPCELENVLAKIVINRVPSIEMVRFVNSGTEACLSVLRLMRAYTNRDKVRLLDVYPVSFVNAQCRPRVRSLTAVYTACCIL